MDETFKNIKQELYSVYEHIFLLAYDKGLDLNKAIQDVDLEIETLKKEKNFEREPESYTGLWMVHSMADKLDVPISQLFISDSKLKSRVVEDILNEAVSEKNNMSINSWEQSSPKETVQIEFSVKRRSCYSTRKEMEMYRAELMNFSVTNELPNENNVQSRFLINLVKEDGVYSILLSGYSDAISNSPYIYNMLEIYSEEHGRVQKFVEECIDIEKNLTKNKIILMKKVISDETSSRQLIENAESIEVKGRELPNTAIDERNNTELVVQVYNTTRTMDILNKFEGLEAEGKPYERLVISNGNGVGFGYRYYFHYVIERGKNKSYVGDITFTDFKLGHVGDLHKHIREELARVKVEDYVDTDVYIKFEKPFHLRAQNKRNRTGYGWEWDWSGGIGDYIEGTLYGETTDYVFAGVYVSSSYSYEPSKRKKIFAKEKSTDENGEAQTNYYKLMVSGYVNGEYTLIVGFGSQEHKTKRIQLFIKAKRNGKEKNLPVACDTDNKLLYMNKATYDCYRDQIIKQQPLILYKTYISTSYL